MQINYRLGKDHPKFGGSDDNLGKIPKVDGLNPFGSSGQGPRKVREAVTEQVTTSEKASQPPTSGRLATDPSITVA